MKAYKLEVLIIDHDSVGEDLIVSILENQKYPNHCLSPQVKVITEAEIGTWTDYHPLNKRATCDAEYDRIFKK